MNLFILTDLEGINGVDDIDFMDRKGEKYALARTLLSKSLDLAIKTAFDAGAEKVYYLDGHGGGGNVIEDMIDDRAEKCSMPQWHKLLKDGMIDCQIELGSHARAGTIGGFLDHTISSRQRFCHKVNGREMSELSLHALVCGAYGVPIIACIGDEAACTQAKEYIPEIFVGPIKKADCRNFSVTYPNCDAILTDTIQAALQNYKTVSTFQTEEPATVELTFYRTDMCEKVLAHCGNDVRRVDARTLQKVVKKITSYADLNF